MGHDCTFWPMERAFSTLQSLTRHNVADLDCGISAIWRMSSQGWCALKYPVVAQITVHKEAQHCARTCVQ